MANISVSDLNLTGLGLFSDSEGFINSVKDLSENELIQTRGGWGYYGSGSGYGSDSGKSGGSGKSFKKSGSGSGHSYYY